MRPLAKVFQSRSSARTSGLRYWYPVGSFAVAYLLDAGESAEFARLHQFTAAHRDGRAAQLRADLDDDARGFRGRVRPVQLADVDRHRLLDVNMLARARGRLEVSGVPVIGRRDEHRVYIGEAEQFVDAPALLRVGSEPLLRLRRRIRLGHARGRTRRSLRGSHPSRDHARWPSRCRCRGRRTR